MAEPARGELPESSDDIIKILVNPIYAGIGPFPALVEEDVWCGAFAILVERHGVEDVVRKMLRELRISFEEAHF